MRNFLKIEFFTILDASGGRLRLNSTNFLQFGDQQRPHLHQILEILISQIQAGFPLATVTCERQSEVGVSVSNGGLTEKLRIGFEYRID
jgi:hypothetical protein